MVGGVPLIYGQELKGPGIELKDTEEGIQISTSVPMRSLAMSEMQKSRQTGTAPADSLYFNYEVDTWQPLKTTTLYQVGTSQFVIKNIYSNARKALISSGKKNSASLYISFINLSS